MPIRYGSTLTARSFLLLCVILLVGCELLDPGGEDDTAETGIDFGQSIEGVTLEDDSTDVLQRFGAPSNFVRGAFPSVTYRYQDSLKGAEFEISTDPTVGGGVISACVYAPYEGETQQGVGIGTTRAEAHDALGPPDNGLAAAWSYDPTEHDGPQGWYDEYWFGDVQFRVEYRANEKVHSICMTPRLDEGFLLTNVEATVVRRGSPRFVIVPDSDKGMRYGVNMPAWVTPPSDRIPASFRKDSLRIVFSGRALHVPPNVRLTAWPLRLISIEELH